MEVINTLVNTGVSILLIFGIIIAFFVVLAIYSRYLVKVPPNSAAVITGGRGFRIVRGGSTLLKPVIERIDFLSLEVLTIQVTISGAYTKEGVPVTIEAVAVVKIMSDETSVRAAAERFLGMNRQQIHDVVNQTLTGHLRSILGTLTVEEINNDRQAFATRVATESATDLEKMGMGIDVLTIQHISDDQGYLDALGKKRTAEVKRDAEVGEAEARRDAMIRSSLALQEGETAKAGAEANIALAQRDRDIKVASYNAEVQAAQAKASQAGPLAEAEAKQKVVEQEVEVERVRTQSQIGVQEQEVLRKAKELEATVIKPAEAEKMAAVVRAEGERQAIVIKAEADAKDEEWEGVGQAARIRNVGQAEANVVQMKGEAEAAALTAKAAGVKAELLAQADGKRADLLAEAEGEKAKLLAEAEGKAQLAQALNNFQGAAIQLTLTQAFIENLPKMVEGAASPLREIGNLTMIDAGSNGGGPLGKLASVVPSNLVAFLQAFQAATGIDLRGALEASLPKAEGAGTTGSAKEPKVVEKD